MPKKKQEQKEKKKIETKLDPIVQKLDLKHKIFECILYVVSYTATLLIVENFVNSFTLAEPKILFAIIASMIIYALNQVVRPIIVTYTMPLTGITFGLFFFVINCLILKITDWVMFSGLNFPRILDIRHIWILFLLSIIFEVLRFLIEDIILKPLVRKVLKNNE